MKIASGNKNGNRSKELVQQVMSSNKKSAVPPSHEKPPTATAPKPIKRVEQAGTKKPKSSAVPGKPVSTDKKLSCNKSTSMASQQRSLPYTTTTKQVARTGNKIDKSPNLKSKTDSFYRSSVIGSEWSDMKKTLRKPRQQQHHNGFNISGSWINELGLTRLPTNLDSDSDYEDDDGLSDFVASDDEGIDEGNAEDYSAAIRDIFGYDRRR